MKYSVTNSIKISGKPTYVLEKPPMSGYVNLLVNIPVTIGVPFKGIWLDEYFGIRFNPDNEAIVNSIGDCKCEFSVFNRFSYLQGKTPTHPGSTY